MSGEPQNNDIRIDLCSIDDPEAIEAILARHAPTTAIRSKSKADYSAMLAAISKEIKELPASSRLPGPVPAARVLIEQWDNRNVSPHAPWNKIEEWDWLHAAMLRRAAYDAAASATRTSVYWLLVTEDEPVPSSAIATGRNEEGWDLFSVRKWVGGYLNIGKMSWNMTMADMIYKSTPNVPGPYEVLVRNAAALRWVGGPFTYLAIESRLPVRAQPFYAVEGGYEYYSLDVFVAQAPHWPPELQISSARSGQSTVFISAAPNATAPHCLHTMRAFRVLAWAE